MKKTILFALYLMSFVVHGYSEKDIKNDSKILSDKEVKKYQQELKINKEKEFDLEFVRTTNLEIFLLNEYGFEGLKLVFSSSNSDNYYQLGNIPEESPWSTLNGEGLVAAIDSIFEPINKKLPELILQMKQRIKFIYAEKINHEWRLHYLLDMKLYDDRDYFQIYTGGQANKSALPNSSLLKYNWSIPNDLREFYSIHDGFGGHDSNFIVSSKDLTVMGEMMNPIAKEQNTFPTSYKFNDLLQFFPDGSGNAQCFLREGASIDNTVDWDHEVWEISEGVGFYEFVDERLSKIDEE